MCSHVHIYRNASHINIYAYVQLQRRSARLINGDCSLLPGAMCKLFVVSSSSSASYQGSGYKGFREYRVRASLRVRVSGSGFGLWDFSGKPSFSRRIQEVHLSRLMSFCCKTVWFFWPIHTPWLVSCHDCVRALGFIGFPESQLRVWDAPA